MTMTPRFRVTRAAGRAKRPTSLAHWGADHTPVRNRRAADPLCGFPSSLLPARRQWETGCDTRPLVTPMMVAVSATDSPARRSAATTSRAARAASRCAFCACSVLPGPRRLHLQAVQVGDDCHECCLRIGNLVGSEVVTNNPFSIGQQSCLGDADSVDVQFPAVFPLLSVTVYPITAIPSSGRPSERGCP